MEEFVTVSVTTWEQYHRIVTAARAYVLALEASADRPFYGTGSALDNAADALVAAVGDVPATREGG
jgi:hypothetical protein